MSEKIGTGKSSLIFKKLRFQNIVRPHNNAKLAFPNSSGLESVFEKLRSLDGLVWTVGLTLEIKLRFKFRNVIFLRRRTGSITYSLKSTQHGKVSSWKCFS